MSTATVHVPAGHARAVRLAAGQRVSVVNTLGQQVADTWALSWPDAARHLSPSHTRPATGRVYPRAGDILVDDRRAPMLRLVADTSPGAHDTLLAACDPQRYRDLGHVGEHRSCAANFAEATAAAGIHGVPVPDPVNLFQRVSITPDGGMVLEPSTAAAGDAVVLEAVTDVLLVVSACPMDLLPISGANASPRSIDLHLHDHPDADPHPRGRP
jgi:uncharacterized protein